MEKNFEKSCLGFEVTFSIDYPSTFNVRNVFADTYVFDSKIAIKGLVSGNELPEAYCDSDIETGCRISKTLKTQCMPHIFLLFLPETRILTVLHGS